MGLFFRRNRVKRLFSSSAIAYFFSYSWEQSSQKMSTTIAYVHILSLLHIFSNWEEKGRDSLRKVQKCNKSECIQN